VGARGRRETPAFGIKRKEVVAVAATKTTPKPAKPASKDGHARVDYLQGALDELTKAIERTREAMKGAGSDAQEQVADWRSSLDRATDDVRRELGILAVHAQRSPEALRAMSAEIRKRKAELSPPK
jgi:ElaB/YqjD/DUF883 family membrane-anchored ribosome-binding protein